MFGWGKKKDDAVVESVCKAIRLPFGILELRLKHFPPTLAQDPYVIGFVMGASIIFAQIETAGQASLELRGRVSLAGLMAAFAPLNFSMPEASAAMLKVVGDPEAKRGSYAADLIIGVTLGMHDRDDEPEIVAAMASVKAMPASIKSMLGGSPQSLLLTELQERLFFSPLEAKYTKS